MVTSHSNFSGFVSDFNLPHRTRLVPFFSDTTCRNGGCAGSSGIGIASATVCNAGSEAAARRKGGATG